MVNAICLSCHNKNSSYKVMVLENVKRNLLSKLNESDINRGELISIVRREGIYEYYNKGCRYGIPCPKLDSKSREINNVLEEVCMYLVAYINTNPDNGEFIESIQWARGKFPKIYNAATRYYYTNKKR